MMRRFLLALAPGAVVVAAAAVAVAYASGASLDQAARGYPLIVLTVATLFAWRLHRPRLLALGITLLAVYAIFTTARAPAHPLAVTIIAAGLPMGVALLAFAPDRGVFRHFAILVAPAAVVGFFSAANPDRAADILGSNLIPASIACIVAFAGAIKTQRSVEAGLVGLTVATAAAMSAAPASNIRGVWMLAAGIALGITLVETAYALAYHDELTGLPSRRALTRTLSLLEAPYAIAVIDVDHFKGFNDQYGHDVGDQVLRMVAAKLARVPGGGTAFRAGGEEFTIVFPGLNKRQAAEHIEIVREAVADAAFVLRNYPRPRGKNASRERGRGTNSSKHLQVTVSAGVASSGAGAASYEDVLAKADQAMYRAKNEGRNCVVA